MVGATPEEKWERGEELKASPFRILRKGDCFVATKAVYFDSEIEVAGQVDRVVLEDQDVEVEFKPTGTRSEALLRFVAGSLGDKAERKPAHG